MTIRYCSLLELSKPSAIAKVLIKDHFIFPQEYPTFFPTVDIPVFQAKNRGSNISLAKLESIYAQYDSCLE